MLLIIARFPQVDNDLLGDFGGLFKSRINVCLLTHNSIIVIQPACRDMIIHRQVRISSL